MSPAVRVAFLATLAASAAQFATIRCNFDGNWSAFFSTGALLRLPPALASEGIYRFPSSTGYDGQYYHYIAHDPLSLRGLQQYIDSPRLRYRRILLPALASLAGPWVDQALLLWNWAALFLGTYWLSRLLEQYGLQAAWGGAFLLLPAAVIGLDRLTVDLAFTALCTGFVFWFVREGEWQTWVIAAAACLTRETGLLLVAAGSLALVFRRQKIGAIRLATAALPSVVWFLLVLQFAPQQETYVAPSLQDALGARAYPAAGWAAGAVTALDWISLIGAVAAVALGIRLGLRERTNAIALGALLFSGMALALGHSIGWYEPFGYPRILSPLLLFLGLHAAATRKWHPLAPLALILPRVLVQLVPQGLGIVRAILW